MTEPRTTTQIAVIRLRWPSRVHSELLWDRTQGQGSGASRVRIRRVPSRDSSEEERPSLSGSVESFEVHDPVRLLHQTEEAGFCHSLDEALFSNPGRLADRKYPVCLQDAVHLREKRLDTIPKVVNDAIEKRHVEASFRQPCVECVSQHYIDVLDPLLQDSALHMFNGGGIVIQCPQVPALSHQLGSRNREESGSATDLEDVLTSCDPALPEPLKRLDEVPKEDIMNEPDGFEVRLLVECHFVSHGRGKARVQISQPQGQALKFNNVVQSQRRLDERLGAAL